MRCSASLPIDMVVNREDYVKIEIQEFYLLMLMSRLINRINRLFAE
jgi:hypothetical protein